MIVPLDLGRQLALVMLPVAGFILWKRRIQPVRSLAVLSFVVYLIVVAALVLAPLPVDRQLINDLRAEAFLNHNFVPLSTIRDVLNGQTVAVQIRQLGGNLLLLAPLGFLLPFLHQRFERFTTTGFAVLIASLAIEATQLLVSSFLGFAYKLFDVDDLLLNAIGGLLGWVAFSVFTRIAGLESLGSIRGTRKFLEKQRVRI